MHECSLSAFRVRRCERAVLELLLLQYNLRFYLRLDKTICFVFGTYTNDRDAEKLAMPHNLIRVNAFYKAQNPVNL